MPTGTTLIVYRVKFPTTWDPLSDRIEAARETAMLVSRAETSADLRALLAPPPPPPSQNGPKPKGAKAAGHFT